MNDIRENGLLFNHYEFYELHTSLRQASYHTKLQPWLGHLMVLPWEKICGWYIHSVFHQISNLQIYFDCISAIGRKYLKWALSHRTTVFLFCDLSIPQFWIYRTACNNAPLPAWLNRRQNFDENWTDFHGLYAVAAIQAGNPESQRLSRESGGMWARGVISRHNLCIDVIKLQHSERGDQTGNKAPAL